MIRSLRAALLTEQATLVFPQGTAAHPVPPPATVSMPAPATLPTSTPPAESPALSPSRMSGRPGARGALWVLALLAATVIVIVILAAGGIGRGWAGVLLGVGVAAAGVVLGFAARSRLEERQDVVGKEAGRLLAGEPSKVALSESLAIQVDAFRSESKDSGAEFLELSIRLMIAEYQSAEQPDDRRKALMGAVDIYEKLQAHITPWYVRRAKLVGFIVSVVGILTGAMSLILGVKELGG